MKNNNLLLIGGIGLLAYFLMRKPVNEDVLGSSGGGTTLISIPSGGSGFDIGGLFAGIGSLLENKNNTQNTQNLSEMDWSKLVPDFSELVPDWSQLVSYVGKGDSGNKSPNGTDKASIMGVYKEVVEGAGNLFRDTAIGIVPSFMQDWTVRPSGNWYDDWTEIQAASEALFEKAGIDEVHTYADAQLLIRTGDKTTGIKADEIPNATPAYLTYKKWLSPKYVDTRTEKGKWER